ncbi:RNA polymerase sigma factor [Sphaerisporangium sp. NPDC051017]|uniref:RNA polymerase sigma factor n=1 Tax=Sphaerisporangium sp. NPDC051017 TaxID=3154636 RepID=UPI0034171C07
MGEDPPGRFVEIYEHAYRPVLTYALRCCQDPDDAADVVAETFMTAWRRIEEVPEGDAARLWLFRVARRVLANHRRGERRHEQRTAAFFFGDPVPADRIKDGWIVERSRAYSSDAIEVTVIPGPEAGPAPTPSPGPHLWDVP